MDTLLRKVVKDISQLVVAPKLFVMYFLTVSNTGMLRTWTPATDVLLQNLLDNGLDVSSLIDERLVSERLGKPPSKM